MLAGWANATAREDEVIDYPPPNKFIPNLPVVPNRLPLGKFNVQAEPKELKGDVRSRVFFKQDDKFDQPLVFVYIKVQSMDCEFPLDKQAQGFVQLWQRMLNEHLRELKYTAQMAKIDFDQLQALNWFGFSFQSLN